MLGSRRHFFSSLDFLPAGSCLSAQGPKRACLKDAVLAVSVGFSGKGCRALGHHMMAVRHWVPASLHRAFFKAAQNVVSISMRPVIASSLQGICGADASTLTDIDHGVPLL